MVEPVEDRLGQLMAAAQRGDAAAYRQVLRDAVPAIAAAARRRGVSADQVEDVVQEVLITLHRARATYDPTRPFLPWLRAIADRRSIDLLRRSGRQAGREVHDPFAYENFASDHQDADNRLEADDRAQALRRNVADLPAGQRQAAERLGLAGESLEEAAAATGRSKTALKVNLHRALKGLRLRMGVKDPAGEGDDV
ncbi:sigma-70 family RNA polymerase sigma factor [Acidisoma cellulosilytica]|uniref:Sigma-70 family RNA polymerase sigma factor n=1 Tax=Acidisoma cellulosilyticum TaxID=2802395 RepID=A0A963Z6J1_9PROT|nr:sigma-70 family RNA polymerase sigma factor [Acidisoma cellulosilyticum]MCB8883476.1 sigma-70 family RNA polymerase sigma factor [Acidisoma cellulosilyticum]